jgi:hypothetical protein
MSEEMGVSMGDALQMATRANDGNGFGGNGAWWIIVLFLFMFGNGGFWGNRGNGQPVTDSGLCDAMNFNNLENAVGRLSDSENLHMMQLSQGLASLGYENARLANETQAGVMQGKYENSRQLAECCCTTQRAIDSVNANINEKFAAIEKGQLQQTISAQQNQLNQLYMQQQLCGVVRYPSATTYSAGSNPYFGAGCCGGF